MATNCNLNELYCEACACIEQGLCYDEIDDIENALAFYGRSLLLIKEAAKEKNFKKNKNKLKKQIEPVHTVEADLVYYIPNGVQLFIIENETTSTPTIPSSLEIFRFRPNQERPGTTRVEAFIQVGLWSYPLIPGSTPVLKNDFDAYIVPNPTPGHPDMFVGILLPKGLDTKDKKDFYSILKYYTNVRTQELSRQMSSDYLAMNINHVAQKTSKIVSDKSAQIRCSLIPDEEPIQINSSIRFGVHYVHKVDKIGDMGISVGKTLASSAEKHLSDSEKNSVVHGTVYVLGVVSPVQALYGLLSKMLPRQWLKILLMKRWGDQASIIAHEVLYATGHTSLAALQLWDLGPRSIAGRAARKAGTQFVADLYKKASTSYLENMKNENDQL
ncbi:Spartin [Dirofilaria immitis]|nr:Spartin [Dirofilaria immitis]